MATGDILPIGAGGGGPYVSTWCCHSLEGLPNSEKSAIVLPQEGFTKYKVLICEVINKCADIAGVSKLN
jgi:hypothetical protein